MSKPITGRKQCECGQPATLRRASANQCQGCADIEASRIKQALRIGHAYVEPFTVSRALQAARRAE